MKQLTFERFETTGVSCPTCGESFDGEVAVKAHHQWHDDAYYDVVIEEKFGVPPAWLVDTLHNLLDHTVQETADKMGVSNAVIQRLAQEHDVHLRDQSEAAKLKWESLDEEGRAARLDKAHEVTRKRAEAGEHQWNDWADEATEEEIKARTAAAHKKTRELTARGENYLQRWRRENPEEAQSHAEEVAGMGAAARDENGMADATGQDNPMWRGGETIYRGVKSQLHGPSWQKIRQRHTGPACEKCESANDLHLHHIVPLMSGGTNEPWNLMTLCRSCHTTVENYIRQFDAFDPVLTE